jgi:hypothetical protein
MTSGTRKKLSEELKIPLEDASRLLIEKEKAVARSEVKYHTKAMSGMIDKIVQNDPEFSDAMIRETLKFLIARHGTADILEDIGAYVETLSETFFERTLTESFRDE